MRKVLMPFFMLGDCDREETFQMIDEAVKAGTDILELGIPHSDPLADGPDLRLAAERAIKAGMTPKKALDMIAEITEKYDTPVYVLTYLNTLYGSGVESFAKMAEEAGVTGLIIPDLPLEAQQALKEEYSFGNLTVAAFTSPTSSDRLEDIVKGSDGLIYSVNYTGITGSSSGLDARVKENYKTLKTMTDRLVLSGFGIDGPKSAKAAAAFSDGVIIGTKIRRVYESADNKSKAVGTFLKEVREAMDSL